MTLAVSSPHLRRYRWILGLFIVGLVLSGITAFPLLHELDALVAMRGIENLKASLPASGFDPWLIIVRDGLRDSYSRYPWIAYGTDWLAFGHIVISLFFIGPWIDPKPNAWVLKIGLIACAVILPLALLCGPIREIPFYWRLIDCSFGLIGALPLIYCLRLTRQLQALEGR